MGMRKRITTMVFMILSTLLIATPFWSSSIKNASERETFEFEEKAALVSIHVSNKSELDKLVASGIDLTEHIQQHEDGSIEVDAIVTPSELGKLRIQGIEFDTIYTKEQAEHRIAERQEKVENLQQVMTQEDTLQVLRANFFENYSGTFLYIEAKTSAGESKSVALTATWDSGQEATLARLEDMGEYLYHSLLIPIDNVPDQIAVESSLGGSATANVTEWVDGEKKPDTRNKHYVQDFTDHYMDPTEVTERIEQLAGEFPDLAEIVELPNKTNGYQRKAQIVLGEKPDSMVVVTSNKWGHEGGNDITVTLTDPQEENASLSVDVEDNAITVSLSTDENGEVTSSAADVVAAINEHASNLVHADTFRDSTGDGTVSAAEGQLDNFLSAPDSVSRDPFTVKAIRIGKHRDGSKVGVLAYSQEHAREWVTPLVSIETAERLLRNYATDSKTRKLVNNLDIFIVPTVNPDGAHYSMYDYNWQRKNMTNHCLGTPYTDPYARNYWGVDINRNHKVGSVYDGHIGASTNCTSGVYAGPEELSEPEAQNLIWLAEQHPNIQFGMNIHSYGGYFMWPPGSYDENRVTLPRPTAGEEAYFWQASNTILDEIKKYRGTVILPSRTGPVPDVLYSAAGNSADALWYDYGIYAWDFEVGADIWNEEENSWERVGFQPPFEEGHAEAMEFANGMIGLLEVAYQFEKDKKPPHSSVTSEKENDNAVEVSFESSEPATIFYTMDGTRPTFGSKKVQLNGTREGAETFELVENTTINWFAMDAAGNVEKNYDPSGHAKNFNSTTITIQ